MTVKSAVKRVSYAAGMLGWYHRRRNARPLTVVTFHRVLGMGDPRWSESDPEYTIDVDAFDRCLAFFQRHYNVVSLGEVDAARQGSSELPERPLLLTFDDGWSDTEEYALERLRIHGVPATVFVTADAVGRSLPFWQEIVFGAWRAKRLGDEQFRRLWTIAAGDPAEMPDWHREQAVRALVGLMAQSSMASDAAVLQPFTGAFDDRLPQMLSIGQLQRLDRAGMAIGCHGQTHRPLTDVPDPEAELRASRERLATALGRPPASAPSALSFPHGRHSARILASARAQGFTLMFTSDQCLNAPRSDGRLSDVLGRISISGRTVCDPIGRFLPESLGLWLFRRPHAALDGAASA